MDWPVSLPRLALNSYAFADAPFAIRSEMESGPARQRLIASQLMTSITASLDLDAAQMVDFRAFYRDTNHGMDWFDMPVDTGQGSVIHRVRMTAPPRYTKRHSDSYTVALALETDEQINAWADV
jgi:hypothetical protein